jgi:hypothetical protein
MENGVPAASVSMPSSEWKGEPMGQLMRCSPIAFPGDSLIPHGGQLRSVIPASRSGLGSTDVIRSRRQPRGGRPVVLLLLFQLNRASPLRVLPFKSLTLRVPVATESSCESQPLRDDRDLPMVLGYHGLLGHTCEERFLASVACGTCPCIRDRNGRSFCRQPLCAAIVALLTTDRRPDRPNFRSGVNSLALGIIRSNHVSCSDITYIETKGGFVYPTMVMD